MPAAGRIIELAQEADLIIDVGDRLVPAAGTGQLRRVGRIAIVGVDEIQGPCREGHALKQIILDRPARRGVAVVQRNVAILNQVVAKIQSKGKVARYVLLINGEDRPLHQDVCQADGHPCVRLRYNVGINPAQLTVGHAEVVDAVSGEVDQKPPAESIRRQRHVREG